MGHITSSPQQRKKKKVRAKIRDLNMARLSVHKTPQHMYAQVFSTAGEVVAAASSLEKELREDNDFKKKTKTEKAKIIGGLVGKRALEKNVNTIAFDRSGNMYHGRVKALADGARESGLEF